MDTRSVSLTGWLARAGFEDTATAARFATAAELEGWSTPGGSLLTAISQVADPDLALKTLVRLVAAVGRDRLEDLLTTQSLGRDRLLRVLGESAALGDHLVRHPEHICAVIDAVPMEASERVRDLIQAVCPQGRGDLSSQDALRVAYRRQLLGILALDVSAPNPQATVHHTAAALADLAGAALEAAVAVAHETHPQAGSKARLAVIAMGKCGGRELNYISDVDVIFVGEPAETVSEEEGIEAATVLAAEVMRTCSAHTGEGTLWQVDPALRPEGKQGPLVRTVASHVRYYKRWAKTWEFQALLKARAVAGDAELGQAYEEAIRPFVWQAASRENFVTDVQAMRSRVERHIPPAEVDRQLKLGPGGLRDVEFSVQLLQLVHGRTDESLRSRNTLEALAALAAGGYVAREDAAALDAAYRFLRSVEHRVQFAKMKRTHLMPQGPRDLQRIGRGLRLAAPAAESLTAVWQEHKRTVRQIHKLLFYRPLLSAVARLRPEDARLRPEAAKERFAALGFSDSAGALRHIEALTAGVSRTAAIQRTLLPVMLGWFAEEVDPDNGLLAFRRISESLGRTTWYLRMLRDEGKAAERLARVLARSRFLVSLLEQTPDAARILSGDAVVLPRSREAVLATMRAAMKRQDDPAEAMVAARKVRRSELFRCALGDLIDTSSTEETMRGLSDLNEAIVQAALDVAERIYIAEHGQLPVQVAFIGMGRLGGRECGFASDADVLAVHRPCQAVSDEDAAAAAKEIVQQVRSLLRAPGPDPSLGFDMDLRPEGKTGPLSRSIAGYRSYMQRWAQAWERQAMVRARPIAGPDDLGEEFVQAVDPYRWAEGGLTDAQVREIRKLKARMEGERLPRGADPRRHFKLGRGGLSDVEWTVQLIQLQHAHKHPTLRTTSTLEALQAAVDLGLLTQIEGVALEEAWVTASQMRDAVMLWRGRSADSVPEHVVDAEAMARILGWGPGSGSETGEHYLRLARHSREVMERRFYGQETS
ncbi:bifunctional [glutamine synthetase] adenylyltransferase/[glutamine synthetase]-adenylyl-L-tyrosine phosphorylase [Dermatophilus congolensis]|uniref:bifunctional [glutamine synthetase] adenylyltransferase/[glutamine synthetase]-adenylyl-L-tyrosine phosphorylase n=1 Tax=Dermatophilus congolensis TaxID=1863 RepID=UPI001AAE349A|nr:bifunctional [glutamine synthetase] adenylyltransferase/[glutamine synthetase]-adenylyl-L-tyrosine phosphorylase [Dermatophilus congolensis]MBO3142964.1 bifunctional [glutamine synthetase] adenylyltransferase/[glutamine synthetase]-adenylyl-L-tyrosine phosphorylase [Dermatophilus congolensis]MBO3151953.1 bifunctional [glutamine synthetase] adenylyltransferase/[glutamine synthetase]-adenylyl-L-tyrosine phosphorylase [Dermatophilus congolensis]MBO3161039.1 bifunctional [glutamine synthetase] ad